MFDTIKEFIKNDLEEQKKKDKLLKSNFIIYLAIVISIISFIIPSILLTEDIIKNTGVLKQLSNDISIVFPSIESKAIIAKSTNLYYYFKFINIISIITILIYFVILLVPISKVYICSLKILKCTNMEYYNDTLCKDKYLISHFVYSILIFFIISIIYFLFYFNPNPDPVAKFNIIFKSKTFIIIYYYMVSYLIGLGLSILTVETFARFYKFYLKLRKYCYLYL